MIPPDKMDAGPRLLDPKVQQCPYSAYHKLRDEAPVYLDPDTEFYVITRFEDVRMILRDSETFGNVPLVPESKAFLAQGARNQRAMQIFDEKGWVPALTLAFMDEPEHKQLRKVFDKAFRPGRVKELEGFVQALAYRLIDDFIDNGRCDWVRDFAVPLPLIVIGHQMGAKEEDIWRIKEWTQAFFHRIGLMLPEEEDHAAIEKEIEAQHYFQPIFEELREKPDGSVLSDLVNTVIEEWGRPMTDNELHAEMMADTFVGGSETTTNALAAGVMLLIENPQVWAQLKSDPEKYLKPFIEEVLRLESPVQGLYRFARKDLELHGVSVPKGATLNIRYAAGNRDERNFPDPEKIDLNRKNPGAHLALGMGKHHCLGAPLARRELYWGFKALTDRVAEMRFSVQQKEFQYHPHYLLRALKSLHIEFTPE